MHKVSLPIRFTEEVLRKVLRVPGVVKALEEKLGTGLIISPHAQVNGAIGAAILAREI